MMKVRRRYSSPAEAGGLKAVTGGSIRVSSNMAVMRIGERTG